MAIESITNPTTEATLAAWQRAYAVQTLQTLPLHHTQIAPTHSLSRGYADSLAAWQRWHHPKFASLFTAAQRPWYAILERARVETIASDDLPGMAFNLADAQRLQPTHTLLKNIYLIARFTLSARSGVNVSGPIFESPQTPTPSWKRWFKQTVLPVAPPNDKEIIDNLQQARVVMKDGQRFAQTVLPLVRALALFATITPSSEAHLPGNPNPGTDGLPEQEDPKSDTQLQSPSDTNTTTLPNLTVEQAYPGYQVLTHQWDEEGPGSRWLSPQNSDALHKLNLLDNTKIRQLANRLQRRLMAARLRHWSFDQEDGRLDNRRLAQLITHTNNNRVFRVETESPVPEACVSLLVDQSGSMRGARQQMTAQAIDLAVHALEACQIRCEVLGYTTRFGADNPIIDQWHRMGSPIKPGRLNALRHIVYKTPNQPWRRNRHQLGLLLREGFGHENIDGEALHWAACRLMRQPQPRKILIVLSDGSPYDQSTALANSRTYLENHLREVITKIELSPIHLVALGAGQDVGRFYRHALKLHQPESVAEVLFDQLAELLTEPN